MDQYDKRHFEFVRNTGWRRGDIYEPPQSALRVAATFIADAVVALVAAFRSITRGGSNA